MTYDTPTKTDKIREMVVILFLLFISGLIAIVIFSFSRNTLSNILSTGIIGILLAFGVFLTGAALGLLFGIPRTLQKPEGDKNSNKIDENTQNSSDFLEHYIANTNFEQISDWITKIVIGIGLTQLIRIPTILRNFSDMFGPSLGGNPVGNTISICIFVFFSINGFLIGYLWTRRYFKIELTKSDLEIEKAIELNKIKSTIEKQNEDNNKALMTVKEILNPLPYSKPIEQEDLNQIVKDANSDFKRLIYYSTENVRIKNRRNNPEIMERTEKIFRALIASDEHDKYYKNHGNLGFVLKDKRNPEWKDAISEFNKAIDLRPSDMNYFYYEFCRAVCYIKLEKKPGNDQINTQDNKEIIIRDIVKAAQDEKIKEIMKNDKDISDWIKSKNFKDLDDLITQSKNNCK